MSNPDIGLFANNNYIPDIGQFSQASPMPGQNMCGYPGAFTFAVPTSASPMTAGFTASSQPRGLYSSAYPQHLIPGQGASWQHARPRTMPCMDTSFNMTSTGISPFNGILSMSRSYDTITSPKPSCSGTQKRNKRQATEDIESASPEHKILLTEEKMAARMKGLNISCTNSTSSSSSSLPDIVLSTTNDVTRRQQAAGLQRLKELEKRLEEDLADNIDREKGHKDRHKFRLKLDLPNNITKNIFVPDPLLPKKILEDLNKPCMEIVLWKPPGGFQKDLFPTEKSFSESLQSKCNHTQNHCQTTASREMSSSNMAIFNTISQPDDDMDALDYDYTDVDMQL